MFPVIIYRYRKTLNMAVLRRFVPLGLMDWLAKAGCENVIELDWWEGNCVPAHDEVTFVCTPSQHWSRRGPADNNKVRVAPLFSHFVLFDVHQCRPIFSRYGPAGPF